MPGTWPAPRHVRDDQQRHRVLDGADRPQRRAGRSARPRHRRSLLRAAVRLRVDQQLRLRRPPRDRYRRGRLPAGPADLEREPARRNHDHPVPNDSRVDRRPMGSGQRRGPVHCARPPGRHHVDPVDSSAVPAGGLPDPAAPEELVFLEKLRAWSQQFPPGARDVPFNIPWPPSVSRGGCVALRGCPQRGGRPVLGLANGKAVLQKALCPGPAR